MLLQSAPCMADIVGDIHVDFTDETIGSYGLSSIGDALLREDILGMQARRHSFFLYADMAGINDYERLANSDTLLRLSLWMEQQVGTEVTTTIGDTEYSGEITRLAAENGMLYDIPSGSYHGAVRYQLQITADYTVRK